MRVWRVVSHAPAGVDSPPPALYCLVPERKRKKLRRQRKLSLHQLRKERHIGSKSHESPSPEDERGVNEDQVGFWQHAAPGHQCYDECFVPVTPLPKGFCKFCEYKVCLVFIVVAKDWSTMWQLNSLSELKLKDLFEEMFKTLR
eukprot:1142562-Pelagomonas_calceolata.AAC.2